MEPDGFLCETPHEELDRVRKQLLRATNEHDTVLAVARSQRDAVTRKYNEQAAQMRALAKTGVAIPRWGHDSAQVASEQRDMMKHELEELRAQHTELLRHLTIASTTPTLPPSPTSVFRSDGDFKSHGEMTLIAIALDTQWTAVREWLDEYFGTWPLVWQGQELYRQSIKRLSDAHIVLRSHESKETTHCYKFSFLMDERVACVHDSRRSSAGNC